MKKHHYVHSSNFNLRHELIEERGFEAVYSYPTLEMHKPHQNEFGRISTRIAYFHFLLGRIDQENCPWCGACANVIKIGEGDQLKRASYAMQCTECGSRGPILNVAPYMEQCKKSIDIVNSLMHKRYIMRRPWDDGFVNHYALGE